ncbi:HNH endonuclease [Staphylococcus carnosus]|uniref:HNH endonuclease n=1 Tax=Staphylococcus carnosus TaxID=1281 RepID=UPI00081A84B5|nr:HNH endonuclease [Staphylococcus carnosus]ANZ34405.1 hypothetical protein BEK99_11860 [Staphylococcus carnosus]UTB79497.1 hypothetical protein A2I65_00570 [Staphylococcus carnosus]UTB84264.1 hypothetical protein A2I66_00480 [Staphylococcus carnosus]
MTKYWLISANHNKYNHEAAFQKWGFIDWKQGNYLYKVNDIVYIYATSPFQNIRYKTQVVEVDKTLNNIVDDSQFWKDRDKYEESLEGRFIRLKLLEKFETEKMHLKNLLKNGLNGAPQGPQRLSEKLKSYLLESEIHYVLYPEIIKDEELYEGIKKQVIVNKYERNPKARQICVNYYGYNCKVCDLNFEKEYGKIGKNFIHVHHIVPLSKIDEQYKIDPIKDLRPVCPNCHAMIHRGLEVDF